MYRPIIQLEFIPPEQESKRRAIMTSSIHLFDILSIPSEKRSSYNIRLNGSLEGFNPLDIYYSDYDNLLMHISRRKWPGHKKGSNPYTIVQKKVLQFIQLREGDKEHWLFVGAFDVLDLKELENDEGEIYNLKRIEKYQPYEARMVVQYRRKPGRTGSLAVNYDLANKELLSDFESRMVVDKISQSPISSLPFPSYENVRLNHRQLVAAVNNSEWQSALGSVQGIYLQTDLSNGWHYVGSAYSEKGESKGILSRWKDYACGDYSGGNKQLQKLTPQHIEKYFLYSILEIFDMSKDKSSIINREYWWMDTLSSVYRESDLSPHGYNSVVERTSE
jgi:hypothetical protein